MLASSQYGGCSANRVDELLAPYAAKNYEKHLADAKVWIEGADRQEAYAMKKTEKDIYDAMQSLEYEINTLYTSQGQTPFTTLDLDSERITLNVVFKSYLASTHGRNWQRKTDGHLPETRLHIETWREFGSQ